MTDSDLMGGGDDFHAMMRAQNAKKQRRQAQASAQYSQSEAETHPPIHVHTGTQQQPLGVPLGACVAAHIF